MDDDAAGTEAAAAGCDVNQQLMNGCQGRDREPTAGCFPQSRRCSAASQPVTKMLSLYSAMLTTISVRVGRLSNTESRLYTQRR